MSTGTENSELANDNNGQDTAAKTIQRNYRGYKGRREMRGCGMSAQERWREVLKDGTYQHITLKSPQQHLMYATQHNTTT